jgi:6-pyruvoyltetrahydropterin/6-carboxytetrahydropterin synthase
MGRFKSTKLFDGFSTVFRQWRAETTHCRFLHGYGVSFRVTFEGELDERNWVWDFGAAKRSDFKIDDMSPKEWMAYMFDHTVIVAEDDPGINGFKTMDQLGVIQLRIVPAVGAEKFAEYIFNKLSPWVENDSGGRVKITSVEFMEHNKNTAIYEREDVA